MRVDSEVAMDLLGPQGIRQRIAELQSRIDKVSPNPKSSFQGLLENNMPNSKSDFKFMQNNSLTAQSDPLQAQNCLNQDIGYEAYSPIASGAKLAPTADLKPMIASIANDHGVDPALFDALVQAESNYDPYAKSDAGACGLTQLMPMTAASLGVKRIYDPIENLNGGAKYLAQQIQKYGNVQDALAAYNMGPTRFDRGHGLPNETSRYVERVLRLYEANKKNG